MNVIKFYLLFGQMIESDYCKKTCMYINFFILEWRCCGLMVFELVSILFAIVPDYGNEYMTKENKNWTSFKNFAPKLNLNHNRDIFG